MLDVTMKLRTTFLVVMLAAVVGFAGVSAYTTATVQRDASVDIESDNNAIVEFVPGNAATITDGQLLINADNEKLNEDAKFTYGDTASPSTTNAFAIRNADTVSHTFTLSAAETSGTNTDLTYAVYDGNGNKLTEVSDGGTASFTASSSTTYYVVVTMNTGDDAVSTYDGTFTVDAS